MKGAGRHFLAALLLLLVAAATPQTPKLALGAVCRVLEGTTTPEKVAASTIYQGQTYLLLRQTLSGNIRAGSRSLSAAGVAAAGAAVHREHLDRRGGDAGEFPRPGSLARLLDDLV